MQGVIASIRSTYALYFFPHLQFSHHLHENASYVRPLEEGMLWLYESITEGTVTVLVISLPSLLCPPPPPLPPYKSLSNLHVRFQFHSQETAVKLKYFSEHFTSYVSYLQKILPYQLQRYAAKFICIKSELRLPRPIWKFPPLPFSTFIGLLCRHCNCEHVWLNVLPTAERIIKVIPSGSIQHLCAER